MPKSKSNDSARGGNSDRQRNRKNNRGKNIPEDHPQLDTGREVTDGNSVGRGTESPEVGGTEASSEGGELSPKQKDPLEYRSVSLRRSQWRWLDELTLDHALKSVSVFLRQLLDNAREAEEEGR